MTTLTELFTILYLVPIIFLIAFHSWFSKNFSMQENAQYKILKLMPFLNILLLLFLVIALSKYCVEYIYNKLKKQKDV